MQAVKLINFLPNTQVYQFDPLCPKMTFDQYINSDRDYPLVGGAVELKEDDCFSIHSLGQDRYSIVLVINTYYYTYLKLANSSQLYVIDEDGNKKARSVFSAPFL